MILWVQLPPSAPKYMFKWQYEVEWFHPISKEWNALLMPYYTRKGACKDALKRALKKRAVNKWRVVDMATKKVILVIKTNE